MMADVRSSLEATSPRTRARRPAPTGTGQQPYDNGLRNLVVIPTYDEAANIEDLVHEVLATIVGDVLIVDDASPDGTGDIADRLAANERRVHVLHRPGKMGLGSAYVEGFRYALAHGYERAYEMDADFSHDPADLARLASVARHAGLVLGSRYVDGGATPGWPIRRRLLSRFANLYVRAFLRIQVRDATSGFRAYDTELLRRMGIEDDAVSARLATGYGFQVEMVWRALRAGAEVVEVPIEFVERSVGVSKMSFATVREAALLVPRLAAGLRR